MPTILLVADDVGQVLDRLGLPAALVQHLPPRIGVVEVDDDAVAGLRRAAGVLGIGDPDLPDDVRAGLTETERLFADAWAAGREPKTRPGEGLAWDAPGFQPPDLPR